MLSQWLSIDETWAWFAVDVTAKATILLLVVAGVTCILRANSAALRHRLWALLFVVLLLLPLVSLALPGFSWRIIRRDWLPSPADAQIVAAVDDRATPPNTSTQPSPVERSTATSPDRSMLAAETLVAVNRPTPSDAADKSVVARPVHRLPLIWLAGALIVLLPLAGGLVGNWFLRHRGRPLVEADWQRLLERLAGDLGLRRNVTLVLGGARQMPMTFGLWRPCVVLPADALDWPPERRRIVLLHELAHAKRYDVPLQMVARLACAVYWFHPLVWCGLRRMRLEREHACDDYVLQAGEKASSYATQLLDIARGHQCGPVLSAAALTMARRSQLEGRLLAVLDAGRSRGPLSAGWASGSLLAAMVLAIALGVVRPTVQADTKQAATDATATNSEQVVFTGKVVSPQGTPVGGALLEVVAMDQDEWRGGSPKRREPGRITTNSDAVGRFEFTVPRETLERRSVEVFASADGFAAIGVGFGSDSANKEFELKLHAAKTVRLQMVDMAGNPVSDLQPQVRSVSVIAGLGLWLPDPQAKSIIKAWPTFSPTGADGFCSAVLAATTTELTLLVDDERFGNQLVRLKVADEPISIALKAAQYLTGKVLATDTGQPLAGAELIAVEEPYRRVLTGADGSFRIPHGTPEQQLFRRNQTIIQIYPPPESPYLFQAVEWKWPDEQFADSQLDVKLSRGIVVEGEVVEKGSGAPVGGAWVYFEPQEYNNSFYREGAKSRYRGAEMKYPTDANGRFRMPVWPGPGYLLVKAPSTGFVKTQVSTGEKYYGKPGLQREYHDGALKFSLKRGESPQPMRIEVVRGVTLRRKVVRPDGAPAEGAAYARSNLLWDEETVNPSGLGFGIKQGVLELSGFEPQASNPLFLFDLKGHCGATVSPTASEIDLASPAIQLQPCGSAKFRFVNDKGEPLADYKPWLLLVITPGSTATHHIEANQPLWCDTITWQNIAVNRRFDEWPRTDMDGRLAFEDLIPGATYRLQFGSKEGRWTDGYEFTVRSGETTDVGEVVIPEHD